MPVFHALGEVPRKRHSAFRRPDGGLYAEELIGNRGGTGPSSLLYHLHRPTRVLRVQEFAETVWERETSRTLRHRHFRTFGLHTGVSPTTDRVPVLFNRDVAISVWSPHIPHTPGSSSPNIGREPFFYRNAQGDEIVFVCEGRGVLESQLGDLEFRSGDYIVIPRGILHRYRLTEGPHRFLVVESAGAVRTPARYRNEVGQLTENAPYCERDIRRPGGLAPHDEMGEFPVVVKKENRFTEFVLDHHPFDVVGWDGYYYPWILNIHDFESRVGRFQLPRPSHETFEGDGFGVASYCPRPSDFDPQAVTAPYNRSDAMSDEVRYYAQTTSSSGRRSVEYASLTLHPAAIPYGPQPGRAEASVGQQWVEELAVVVDTSRPLLVSKSAVNVEDKDYYHSWLGNGGDAV